MQKKYPHTKQKRATPANACISDQPIQPRVLNRGLPTHNSITQAPSHFNRFIMLTARTTILRRTAQSVGRSSKLRSQAIRALTTQESDRHTANILWFDELSMADVGLVGGKNASLGEMYRQLTPMGVKIPNGFAVTASAYHHFLREAGIAEEIRSVLNGLDIENIQDLETRGALCRGLIINEEMPQDLKDDICAAYAKLEQQYSQHVDTAVRSSATAEDLPDASFVSPCGERRWTRGCVLVCRNCGYS